MEIEKKDRHFKVFCEQHRPLKIIKEVEDRDKQAYEEIQKYAKILDKCIEIGNRNEESEEKVQKVSKPSKR